MVKNMKMLKFIRNIILYLIGISCLIVGVAYISETFFPAVLVIVSGLLMFPSIYNKIGQYFGGKIKGWKYVVIATCLLFVGMGMLEEDTIPMDENIEINKEVVNKEDNDKQEENYNEVNNHQENSDDKVANVTESIIQSPKENDKKKIDKALKKENYKNLVEMYSELDETSKNYFVEQMENKTVELLQKEEYISNETIKEIEDFLENFMELKLNSELMEVTQSALQRLEEYSDMERNLRLYKSPIPEGSEEQWLDVYITNRVENSGITGGYTDYYVAYPYTYLFGEPYPDYDGEQIIVYSEEPLSKGVNFFSAVENGTYETIDRQGFEYTNRLFYIYSEEEWEEYYSMLNKKRKEEALSLATIMIREEILKDLSKKDSLSAKEILNAIGSSLYCGYWYDANNGIFLDIIQAENSKVGKLDISLWSSNSMSDLFVIWTLEGAYYDMETGTILYENSICEQEYTLPEEEYLRHEVIYSGGVGEIFLKDGLIYWEDSMESLSTSCEFSY